jgi:hypothetical protein
MCSAGEEHLRRGIMRMARCGAAVAVLAALVVGVIPALAAPPLDTPGASLGLASRVSVKVNLTAGATGAPAGFLVEWMRASDYQRLGGWPTDVASEPTLVRTRFYGVPSLNPSTGTYRLDGYETVEIEIGDLFDETGILTTNSGELQPAEDLVIRAYAVATGGFSASGYTQTLGARTLAQPPENCTYTIGYWKSHADAWPVASLTLGTVTYSKAQLLSILDTPAKGNGLIILAHQLIAAKLNIAAGADPTPVASALAAADALIGGLIVPPVGSGYLDPSAVTTVKDTLDGYNNGLLGVPHCGQVPTVTKTWGGVKAIYR